MTRLIGSIGLWALLTTWLIYPLLIALMGAVRHRAKPKTENGVLAASVVIATRDDAAIVRRRIQNLEDCAGELHFLEIIVAVDRTSGTGFSRYRELLSGCATVIAGDPPGGKAVTLNAGVRHATQEVVIFADSAQAFLPGTLASLIRTIKSEGIGAATGRYAATSNRRSVLLRVFWAYETWLRRIEASVISLVGVTGAVYGMRRRLWQMLPPGLINDDLYVPYAVVQQGFRVVECDTAIAIDSRTFTARQEFRRKVRTLTGILQLCKLRPGIFIPGRSPLWFSFVCHKLMRFATPYWLALTAIGLISELPLGVVGATAIAIAALVILFSLAPSGSLASRLFRQGVWAGLVISAPFVATANALLGRWNVWGSAGSAADQGP